MTFGSISCQQGPPQAWGLGLREILRIIAYIRMLFGLKTITLGIWNFEVEGFSISKSRRKGRLWITTSPSPPQPMRVLGLRGLGFGLTA